MSLVLDNSEQAGDMDPTWAIWPVVALQEWLYNTEQQLELGNEMS